MQRRAVVPGMLAAVAVLWSGGVAVAAPALADAPSRTTLRAAAVAVEFEDVHGPNYARVEAEYPGELNWLHDGCSVPAAILRAPGLGAVLAHYSGVFVESCNRHDFGYHNFGVAPSGVHPEFDPTRAEKNAIDARFKANMKIECAEHDSHWYDAPAKVACDSAADVFYDAVHVFGDSSYFG